MVLSSMSVAVPPFCVTVKVVDVLPSLFLVIVRYPVFSPCVARSCVWILFAQTYRLFVLSAMFSP